MHLLQDVALTAIKAYAKCSVPDQALYLFQRMVDIFGCKPGIKSYNSMFNAFFTYCFSVAPR